MSDQNDVENGEDDERDLNRKRVNSQLVTSLHKRVTKEISKASDVSEVFYKGIRHERIWA